MTEFVYLNQAKFEFAAAVIWAELIFNKVLH